MSLLLLCISHRYGSHLAHTLLLTELPCELCILVGPTDGSNVLLIEELVKEYIGRERAIIVATISCKDDIDNQASKQQPQAADWP